MRILVDPGSESNSIEPWARSTRPRGTGGSNRLALGPDEARAVVATRVIAVVGKCEIEGPPGAAMADRVADRFTKHLLEVEWSRIGIEPWSSSALTLH